MRITSYAAARLDLASKVCRALERFRLPRTRATDPKPQSPSDTRPMAWRSTLSDEAVAAVDSQLDHL